MPSCVQGADFFTASEQYQHTRKIKPYLVQIIRGLQDSGRRINLDQVELAGLDMEQTNPLNLSGMSAQRASFISINMQGLILDHADLTGAIFTNANMNWVHLEGADITDAVFSTVSFKATLANELTGNQPAIFKCREVDSHYGVMEKSHILFVNSWLYGVKLSAVPGKEKFTLTSKWDSTQG